MIIFGLAAFLVQCCVNSPVTSLSHVCGWTVSGARAPYMCVPARVCTSLREPRYRYTEAKLLSLSKPYVCSSDVFTRLVNSTLSALFRRLINDSDVEEHDLTAVAVARGAELFQFV